MSLAAMRRSTWAAWLAVLALIVQTYIPVHLAAATVVAPVLSHEDARQHRHVQHHPHNHSHDAHLACQLCLALHHGSVGLGPLPDSHNPGVPSLAAGAAAVALPSDFALPRPRPAPYASRAPPLTG